jgi:hypothetical protein
MAWLTVNVGYCDSCGLSGEKIAPGAAVGVMATPVGSRLEVTAPEELELPDELEEPLEEDEPPEELDEPPEEEEPPEELDEPPEELLEELLDELLPDPPSLLLQADSSAVKPSSTAAGPMDQLRMTSSLTGSEKGARGVSAAGRGGTWQSVVKLPCQDGDVGGSSIPIGVFTCRKES